MAWLKALLSSSPPRSSSSLDSSQASPRSHPKLTRSKKLRYLSDDDVNVKGLEVENSRSKGRERELEVENGNEILTTSAVPLPLPVEEASYRLSPRKGREERERESVPFPDPVAARASCDGAASTSRGKIWNSEPRRSADHAEVRESTSFHQNLNVADRAQHKYSIQVPNRSAPTSLYSSPAASPQRRSTGYLYTPNPMVSPIWSMPEMPMTGTSSRFPYAAFQENIVFDGSPSPSSPPLISPMRPLSSVSVPVSLGRPQLVTEVPVLNRETNLHASGHPLPRPPVGTSPGHVLPGPITPSKPEVVPMSSQWVKGKLIGRGTFGSVYIATNRETGATCAMKEVEVFHDDPNSVECMKQLEQEIKVLSQLDHPNIVRYYGSEIIEDRILIYLEYVYPGSVNRYIRDNGGAIRESVVRNFTRHILSGLAYLHSTKTIHRDIKGANLLVDLSGVVKLADFGMAKHLSGKFADLSLKGSSYWIAPELLLPVRRKDKSPDVAFATDIWSLGCTVIEMVTGKPPWGERPEAAAMFKALRDTPPIPESLSSEGKDFLRLCFQRNPADRPTASRLLEHRFLKNSQQLDFPPQDRAPTSREFPRMNLDQTPMSSVAKPVPASGNESGRRSHSETSTMGPRHSPQSTLDALPSLSPPRTLPTPVFRNQAA
ncbi:hypothetical protein Drorol1_Dr00010695 [Drosera rotundifolia]